MNESNSVYLHFLDRELSGASGGGASGDTLMRATRILTCASDAKLYCGLSHLWENGQLSSAQMADFEVMFGADELVTMSGDPNKGVFLEGHRVSYEHDMARYPNYFSDTPPHLAWAEPNYHKTTGSTGPVEGRLYQWAGSLPSSTSRITFARNEAKGPVIRALQEREGRAITYTLFKPLVDDSPRAATVEALIRRQISLDYSFGNLREVNADIATGIQGFKVFDELLAKHFPLYDVFLLGLLGRMSGIGDVFDRTLTSTDEFAAWVVSRQSFEARLFCATCRWIVAALGTADSLRPSSKSSDPENYFTQEQVRQRVRERIWAAGRALGNPAGPAAGGSHPGAIGPQFAWANGQRRLVLLAERLGQGDRLIRIELDRSRENILLTSVDLVLMTANDLETAALRAALARRRRFCRNPSRRKDEYLLDIWTYCWHNGCDGSQ